MIPDPTRQKVARGVLADLFAYPSAVYAVHYACQSFYRGEQVRSPRVGVIALRNLGTKRVVSFSLSEEAELSRLAPQQVSQHIDILESRLLSKFFDFVRTSRHTRYVHWNMNDARFGFDALEHRFRVLGGVPEAVHEGSRIDLASLTKDLYGSEYVKESGKLERLARINAMSMGGFLRGSLEAEAFEQGRYRDVLASTLTKVRIISEISTRAHDSTLKTLTPEWRWRKRVLHIHVQKIRDHPIVALGLMGLSAVVSILKIFDHFLGR